MSAYYTPFRVPTGATVTGFHRDLFYDAPRWRIRLPNGLVAAVLEFGPHYEVSLLRAGQVALIRQGLLVEQVGVSLRELAEALR